MTRDDFDYALENTRVILAPEHQIATFGSTSFNFYLISELMDRVNQVRIRNGKIQAERPQILTPEHYCRLLLEGFGDKAERYVDQLREHARNIAVLRYGFQFRKTDLNEQTLSDSIDTVINRTRRQVENKNEPLSAIIQGVDDAWEVCLLKFTIDLVERSSGGNLGDFRKRGLIRLKLVDLQRSEALVLVNQVNDGLAALECNVDPERFDGWEAVDSLLKDARQIDRMNAPALASARRPSSR